jgi:Protein of unknown function (DUF3987)/Bifunctional DNA primase/polymerase, N-terminal
MGGGTQSKNTIQAEIPVLYQPQNSVTTYRFSKMTTSTTELTTALQALPQEWALTTVNQKKAYFAGWQQTGLARESIEQEIASGKADGFGILTGELSGGLIAIDCDGHEPHARFREILGGEIPETVSFASGKEGRAQYLYSIPQEHWANISTKKEGSPKDGGQLEFRWNGCYSVLPPSAHPETDGYHWINSPDDCSIAPLPEKALEHLLTLCKPKVSPVKPAPKKAGDVPPIPLKRCLSNAHRQALENGVGEGLRSNTAISLGRDLLGCAAWLDALNEPYSGDAQSLYIEYCNRCSPPIKDSERGATWRSANNYPPEPAISDAEAFQNCIEKWKREHGVTATERPVESNTTPLMDAVTAAVNNLSGAGLTAELAAIAEKYKRSVGTIKEMAAQILDGIESANVEMGTQESIEWLQNVKTNNLDIADVLPLSIADPLKKVADSIGHNHEPYALAALFAAGGIANIKTWVKVTDTFRQPPTIYVAFVAKSGTKKTALYKTVFERPFGVMQTRVNDIYKEEFTKFEDELQVWEATPKENRKKKPVEPRKYVLYSPDATIEGLVNRAAEQQRASVFYTCDELNSIFRSANSYKNKGSDEEALLIYYEGQRVQKVRADSVTTSDDEIRFAVMGTIQPKVLMGSVKDDDANGGLSRFLCCPLHREPKLLKRKLGIDLNGFLVGIYEAINKFPATELEFDQEAFDFYNNTQLEWEKKADTKGDGWESNIWSKAGGYLVRLSGALHLLECGLSGDTDNGIPPILQPTIGVETVRKAKILTDYCINFNVSMAIKQSGVVSPKLQMLIELSRAKGINGLSVVDAASALRESINGKQTKPKSEVVIGHFLAIKTMGLGTVEKTARSYKLFSPEISPSCPSRAESQSSKDFESGLGSRLVKPSSPSCCPDEEVFSSPESQLGLLGLTSPVARPVESFAHIGIQPIGTTRTNFPGKSEIENPDQEEVGTIEDEDFN